jgi:thiosulfate/3-mercaptopyruvate sulfurtransferase
MTEQGTKKYLFKLGLCFLGLLAVQVSARPQGLPGKLVTSEWLASNLTAENLRIVDMRNDIRDYWLGHIPGAIYLDSSVIRWPDQGVPSKLLPPSALATLLGDMGIGENTSVVVYYDKNGYPPFYFIWALDYIGHKSSALLNDGIEKWKREGRLMTQDYPAIKPTKYTLPFKLRAEVRATLEDVIAETKAGAILLDVRPQDLFSGEKGAWKRKGHIKGAVSHFWALDMNTDGTFKTKEELIAGYEKIGVTPDKSIIVYCGQGQMSAHTYFVLKHILGFPKVKLYDGGFNEWSNRDDLPVETGM